MISLSMIVSVVIALLVAGLVFGLLFWLISYIGGQFPVATPFVRIANVVLMILMVLFLIGMLLSFAGHPVIQMH
jgi:hypothetical protein